MATTREQKGEGIHSHILAFESQDDFARAGGVRFGPHVEDLIAGGILRFYAGNTDELTVRSNFFEIYWSKFWIQPLFNSNTMNTGIYILTFLLT